MIACQFHITGVAPYSQSRPLGVVKLMTRDDVRRKLVNGNGTTTDPKKLLERLVRAE